MTHVRNKKLKTEFFSNGSHRFLCTCQTPKTLNGQNILQRMLIGYLELTKHQNSSLFLHCVICILLYLHYLAKIIKCRHLEC